MFWGVIVLVIFITLPKLWTNQAVWVLPKIIFVPLLFSAHLCSTDVRSFHPHFFRPYSHILAELCCKVQSGIMSGRSLLDSVKSPKLVFFLPPTLLVPLWRLIDILTHVVLSSCRTNLSFFCLCNFMPFTTQILPDF